MNFRLLLHILGSLSQYLATFITAMQEMGAVYQHCLKIN